MNEKKTWSIDSFSTFFRGFSPSVVTPGPLTDLRNMASGSAYPAQAKHQAGHTTIVPWNNGCMVILYTI